jgi:hypothetical protein
MATGLKTKPTRKGAKATAEDRRVLYLYAISQEHASSPSQISAEGIDGQAAVESTLCEGYFCWFSRVGRAEFADRLTEHMEDLEWLASAGLRHQRVVSEIAGSRVALPARFGTVFLSDVSMAQHVRKRKQALEESFKRVADADEWGIKVFGVTKVESQGDERATVPSSGAEYLKRKAKSRQTTRGRELDGELLALAEKLTSLAVASSPGGKASAGQPGLLWHGSFLIRRRDRNKLEDVLKEYTKKWHNSRRIDWSGPWPPYSFVG